MVGYYPDGVTGNEPQIRGMDERTTHKECGAESEKLHIMPDSEWLQLQQILSQISLLREREADKFQRGSKSAWRVTDIESYRSDIIKQVERLGNYLKQDYTEEMLTGYTDECPFVGEVDTQYSDGYEYWDCPLCGTEHEEEIDMYPDDPRI